MFVENVCVLCQGNSVATIAPVAGNNTTSLHGSKFLINSSFSCSFGVVASFVHILIDTVPGTVSTAECTPVHFTSESCLNYKEELKIFT